MCARQLVCVDAHKFRLPRTRYIGTSSDVLNGLAASSMLSAASAQDAQNIVNQRFPVAPGKWRS